MGQRERIFPEPSNGHLYTRTVVYAYARTSRRQEDESGENERQIAEIVAYETSSRLAIEQFYIDRGVRLFEGNPRRPRQPQINLERLFNDVASDPRPNKVIMATNVR
jgi:DNA invertase Pin-like site-specific DNA recombinase